MVNTQTNHTNYRKHSAPLVGVTTEGRARDMNGHRNDSQFEHKDLEHKYRAGVDTLGERGVIECRTDREK